MTIAQTHVDPGIAADIADILLADSELVLVRHELQQLGDGDRRRACNRGGRQGLRPDVVDAPSENTVAIGGGDVGDQLRALGLARTAPLYHRKPNEMMGAALAGLLAPKKAGSWTAAYKPLAGVTADVFTATQIATSTRSG
jgi:hypothetical protein